jgi:D-amino-acid oxidase
MITRRQILQGGAAAALLLPTVGIKQSFADPANPVEAPLEPLRAKFLQTPNLRELRKSAQFVSGVRPHRIGGVCLSMQEIATANGDKFLIHNYGHSGAGITLSWGCASVVGDHVQKALEALHASQRRASVAVIGTGIIGLTVATELRSRYGVLPITIYAKSLDLRKTTSYIAGGQFEPSQIGAEYTGERHAILEDYLQRSVARIRETILKSKNWREYGYAERPNFTLDHPYPSFDVDTPRDIVPAFKRGLLPFDKLSAMPGREYSTWLINPKMLLPKLASDLRRNKVRFVAKEFEDRKQIEALKETILINCTGYGARELFEDCAVQPRRGHLVFLKNPKQLRYFFSGGCGVDDEVVAYLFARQTDIVIGGTVIRHDDREFDHASNSADTAVCKHLIDNMQQVFEGHPEACTRPAFSSPDRSGDCVA